MGASPGGRCCWSLSSDIYIIVKSTRSQSLFFSEIGHFLARTGEDSECSGFPGGGMSRLTGMCGICGAPPAAGHDLRLLLPAVAERVEKAINRLIVEDVSADRGWGPIFDGMFIRSTDHQHLP
jgi:hypothetical protein